MKGMSNRFCWMSLFLCTLLSGMLISCGRIKETESMPAEISLESETETIAGEMIPKTEMVSGEEAETETGTEEEQHLYFLWDPETYEETETERTVSSEEWDLRIRANRIGERYGVRLRISTECYELIGGYSVEPILDRLITDEALDAMETELAKYPEGFLSELASDYPEGMEIWLAGALRGVDDETLDIAGGFTNKESGCLLLVMDSSLPELLPTTFHHEMSHIIDEAVKEKMPGTWLENVNWERLNPAPSISAHIYTYTYTAYGYEDCLQWVYDGSNGEEAFFIDTYSMTFPTEDRARLFENIMCREEESLIPWDECPRLREKMNVYAACIRYVLGKEDWENVRWERLSES